MARILYALNGQGRGHTSRALALTDVFRRRGHEVRLCCGEPTAARLRDQGEDVLDIPTPAEIVRGNRVQLAASAAHNLPLAVRTPEIVADLAERLTAFRPDLVLSDFEPFAPRAARRLGVPTVALDHQHVLTEARCRVPARYAASAALTRLGTSIMAPRQLFDQIIVPSFFFPPLRPGSRAHLVPPVLRRSVLDAVPTPGEHVLVYVNHPDGSGPLLRTLRTVDASFVVYNVAPPSEAAAHPNLAFRALSPRFVDDLAASRAVVCTAGFTLLSEAMWLGKPVLALPNRGFFEQALNAFYLRASGRGDAAFGRLRPGALARFLDRPPSTEPGGPVGNDRAADLVEAVLPRRVLVAVP